MVVNDQRPDCHAAKRALIQRLPRLRHRQCSIRQLLQFDNDVPDIPDPGFSGIHQRDAIGDFLPRLAHAGSAGTCLELVNDFCARDRPVDF
jgi:hypothetical protein